MNKSAIIADIISQLRQDLSVSELAAEQARKASTDEQSVAETQYDTLAIESAYLAEGQSKRIAEITDAIKQMEALPCKAMQLEDKVTIGTCVQIVDDQALSHFYFVAPVAGGMQLQLAQNRVTVITPHSPIGQALLGKYCDDEFELKLAGKTKTGYIEQVT